MTKIRRSFRDWNSLYKNEKAIAMPGITKNLISISKKRLSKGRLYVVNSSLEQDREYKQLIEIDRPDNNGSNNTGYSSSSSSLPFNAQKQLAQEPQLIRDRVYYKDRSKEQKGKDQMLTSLNTLDRRLLINGPSSLEDTCQ
jgi:hypothetical protein